MEHVFSCVETLDYKTGPREMVLRKIRNNNEQRSERSIYVCNLGNIIQRYETWNTLLPDVTPFYVVKCNSDTIVLTVLADLGSSFSCSCQVMDNLMTGMRQGSAITPKSHQTSAIKHTIKEIDKVLDLGVPPEKIIYSNPFKSTGSVKRMARLGVRLLVFDTEEELKHIIQHHPTARLLLRVKAVGFNAALGFDEKYGCGSIECRHLLTTAKDLGVDIEGLCFKVDHVSEATDGYEKTIRRMRDLYDAGKRLGHKIGMINIGGGYPGSSDSSKIEGISETIKQSLEKHFGTEPEVTYIAEPCRFMVESAFSLAVQIIGKRKTHCKIGKTMYYLNDGVFGSIPNHVKIPVNPIVFTKRNLVDGAEFPSILWGPTCTADDLVASDISLPDLDIGDWIYLLDMGVQNSSSSGDMEKQQGIYCCSQEIWSAFMTTRKNKLESS